MMSHCRPGSLGAQPFPEPRGQGQERNSSLKAEAPSGVAGTPNCFAVLSHDMKDTRARGVKVTSSLGLLGQEGAFREDHSDLLVSVHRH